MKGNFHSAYDQGFARVAACTTTVHIGDPASNMAGLLDTCRELDSRDVAVAVFPELCLTGYAIDDLLLQDVLLDAVLDAIETLRQASRDLFPVVVVGAPLQRGNRLYNCAVVVHRGQVLGVVPKSYLPNYREFYEKRHFAAGAGTSGIIDLSGRQKSHVASIDVPFGTDQLFQASDLPDLTFHVEVCEDLWVPVTPSSQAALAGAVLEVNLSGSPITVGKSRQRHELCKMTSSRNLQAYVYAAAGPGESSTDLSWDGQTMIYENGSLLAATDRFSPEPGYCLADIDLDLLRQERMRQGSFDDNALSHSRDKGWRTSTFTLAPPHEDIGLERPVDRFPFVPNEPDQLAQDCYEAYNIQVYGLRRRLESIGSPLSLIHI